MPFRNEAVKPSAGPSPSSPPPPAPTPSGADDVVSRLRAATEVLEQASRNRAWLARLPVEERTRLLKVAGEIYAPDPDQRRRLLKARTREHKAKKAQRERSQAMIQEELRRQFPTQIIGVRPSINQTRSIFGGMGQPIRIYVQGPEVTRLKLAAEQVMQAMRDAIDRYKDACDLKQVEQDPENDCYPKSLDQLVEGVALVNVPEADRKVRFLRRIPIDPMTGRDDWVFRCVKDEPDSRFWCGDNVFDVSSRSMGIGLDGTNYSDW